LHLFEFGGKISILHDLKTGLYVNTVNARVEIGPDQDADLDNLLAGEVKPGQHFGEDHPLQAYRARRY
jgi:hypothetical protein